MVWFTDNGGKISQCPDIIISLDTTEESGPLSAPSCVNAVSHLTSNVYNVTGGANEGVDCGSLSQTVTHAFFTLFYVLMCMCVNALPMHQLGRRQQPPLLSVDSGGHSIKRQWL